MTHAERLLKAVRSWPGVPGMKMCCIASDKVVKVRLSLDVHLHDTSHFGPDMSPELVHIALDDAALHLIAEAAAEERSGLAAASRKFHAALAAIGGQPQPVE